MQFLTKGFLIITNIKFYLLIFMCYNISTGLFDTKIRRLYMYDKPGQLCRLPRKSQTVDCVLFEKEIDFCRTFVLAVGQLACGLAYE